MKKILFGFFLVLFIFFIGYSINKSLNLNTNYVLNSSINCAKDAKICADGSVILRVSPNCEFSNCSILKNDSKINSNKLKICPDKKIINKMPQIIGKNQSFKSEKYFIIKGKRTEISNYDLTWISKNCNVKTWMVY